MLFTQKFEKEMFSDIDRTLYDFSSFHDNELPICQTIIDSSNWTLVTTRQIFTCKGGLTKLTKADNVLSWQWNDFKGYKNELYTIGQLELVNLRQIEIFIETGKASMVMIYTITSLVRQLSALSKTDK